MSKIEIEAPKKKIKKVEIDTALKVEARSLIQEEMQVVIKCSYKATEFLDAIRINKATFLIPHGYNFSASSLQHAENITMFPEWTFLKPGITYHFTLIFSGLPKGCNSFDLVEKINSPGAFVVRDIKRNDTDVYYLNLEL